MSDTFSLQTLSNGLVAVGAGLVVNTAAEMHGFLGHFVVAIIPLSLVAITVFYSCQENFGSQSNDMMNSLSRGFDLIRKDFCTWYCTIMFRRSYVHITFYVDSCYENC